MRLLIPMSLAAFLATLCMGAAQTALPHGPGQSNPAGTPGGTREAAPGVPAPRQPNQADRTFLRAATMAGTAEVEFSQLAGRMSKNQGVKEFAQRMVRDHQDANKRVGVLAKNAGLPLLQGLDPDHKAVHDRLSKLQGIAFDRGYIESQIVDHQTMAQLLEYEIGSGQDKESKDLAAELLPSILDHLQAADVVLASLTGSTTKQP